MTAHGALVVAALFAGLFLTGYGLGRSGSPYPAVLSNLHKFVGLGAGVYLALIVRRLHLARPLTTSDAVVVAVTVLLALATVAAGGILSAIRPAPPLASLAHRVLPYLTVAAAAVGLYLLTRR